MRIACLLVVLLVPRPVPADSSAGLPAAYLRTGWGARAAALGNALVAGAEGPEAAYWDSAALASLNNDSLASSYDWLSLQRQFNTAALAVPTRAGVFAVSWTEFSLGNDFEGRTTDTASFYTFGDRQDVYSLSFGTKIEDWIQFGASLKDYQHDLDVYHAQGLGFDLGSRVIVDPRLVLAVDAQDLAASLAWNTGTRETIPWVLRVGLWATLWPQTWELGLQAQEVNGGDLEASVGSEFHLLKFLALRAGWMSAGPTFGGGLRLPVARLTLDVDYAYLPDPLNLGPDQRVGVRLDF